MLHETPKLVYRLEGHYRYDPQLMCGFYRSVERDKVCENIPGAHYVLNNCTNPYRDPALNGFWGDGIHTGQYYFGFSSLRQMVNYFGRRDILEEIANVGTKLATINVHQDWYDSGIQTIFHRNNLDSVVERIPLSDVIKEVIADHKTALVRKRAPLFTPKATAKEIREKHERRDELLARFCPLESAMVWSSRIMKPEEECIDF